VTYGVPDICWSRPISVAKTNMGRDGTDKINRQPNFVDAITFAWWR
jgi:hypothetical protein